MSGRTGCCPALVKARGQRGPWPQGGVGRQPWAQAERQSLLSILRSGCPRPGSSSLPGLSLCCPAASAFRVLSKNTSSGVRPPGFKSWLCWIQSVLPSLRLQLFFFHKMRKTIELLRGLSVITQGERLGECRATGRAVNISSSSSSSSSYFIIVFVALSVCLLTSAP